MPASQPPTTVEQVLADREVRGLRVPAIGRILVALLTLGNIAYIHVVSEEPPFGLGMLVPFIASTALMIGLNGYFLHLLRRRRHVLRVGYGGAVFDAVFLILLVVMMQFAGAQAGIPMAFTFQSEIALINVLIIVINALALQPAYPLVVTAGAFASLVYAAAVTSSDPNVVMSVNPRDVVQHGAVDPTQVFNVIFMVTCTGLVVSYITALARRTARSAVEAELEKSRLEREQVQLVMREKVQALGKLVAGVSHEINNPIGVITSGVDTQQRVLDKLSKAEGGEHGARILSAAHETLGAMATAAERIARTEVSLRALAHLDEGSFQRVDLKQELERVLEAVVREKGEVVEVCRNYAAVPPVHLSAADFNQALLTIVRNAFEAIDGRGRVTVSTGVQDGWVRIGIEDSGRGLDEGQLAGLFDVRLRERHGRVAAGFGLPAAQSTVQLHGGRMQVRSQPGQGTRFEILLPLPEDGASVAT